MVKTDLIFSAELKIGFMLDAFILECNLIFLIEKLCYYENCLLLS